MTSESVRINNAVKGMFWGFIQKVFSIVFPFAVRTVLIYKLGIEYTGLGSLFNAILSMLSMAELGLGSAIVFSMYRPIHENDNVTLQQYLNFYKKCYQVIGLVILLIGLILLPFLPKLVSKDCPVDINIYILYLIYLANTVISYFLFAYKSSILNAAQRTDVVNKITIISSLFLNTSQIIVLLLFSNFYVYSVVIPFGTVVNNLLINYYANKLFPNVQPKGDISPQKKKEIFTKIKGLLCQQIGTVVLTSVDTIVITYYMGLKECGIYNNYYYIINAVFSIFVIIYTSLLPAVGDSLLSDTHEKKYERFEFLFFLSMCLNTFCVSCLYNLFQPFIKLWVGKSSMYEFPIVVLFCIYFYFSKIGDVASVYKSAAGLWDKMKYTSIVAAGINLVLNLVLTKYIGVYGIILSTLFAYIVVYLPFYSYPVFKFCFKNEKAFFVYNLKIIFHLVIALIISVLVSFATMMIPDNNINGFIIKTFAVIILSTIFIVIAYLPAQRIQNTIRIFSKIIKKET